MVSLSQPQRDIIRTIASKFGAMDVRLFGSRARNTSNSQSDVDLLVRFGGEATLLTVIGFQQAVQDALGMPVDVVEEEGLSSSLPQTILSEAVAL